MALSHHANFRAMRELKEEKSSKDGIKTTTKGENGASKNSREWTLLLFCMECSVGRKYGKANSFCLLYFTYHWDANHLIKGWLNDQAYQITSKVRWNKNRKGHKLEQNAFCCLLFILPVKLLCILSSITQAQNGLQYVLPSIHQHRWTYQEFQC